MSDQRICYSGGYKYQIRNDYVFRLPKYFPQDVIYEGEFLSVSEGHCTIHRGYAGDGPSGPIIDTKSFMRGAWQHDALYQLIRLKVFPQECRDMADKQLVDTCKEDGMLWPRRQWVYYGLKYAGAAAAKPQNIKKIIWSP
tara:strand:- start:1094 stop:1513 length:420 start_codon:yes stop_codon:yes gene_type:complete